MNSKLTMRYIILGAIFTLVGIAIVGRLIHIQIGPDNEIFVQQGEFYSGAVYDLKPSRGKIYDRWGNLLAGNETIYEIGVNLEKEINP